MVKHICIKVRYDNNIKLTNNEAVWMSDRWIMIPDSFHGTHKHYLFKGLMAKKLLEVVRVLYNISLFHLISFYVFTTFTTIDNIMVLVLVNLYFYAFVKSNHSCTLISFKLCLCLCGGGVGRA